MHRRGALGLGLALGVSRFARAAAQSGVWPEWTGLYDGTIRFQRSIPLQDIYPPPPRPWVDLDSREPIAVAFAIANEGPVTSVWLRIDAGPMQTSDEGETLRFGAAIDGLAAMIGSHGRPVPRSAGLLVHADSVGTEALFSHADGSFWRRHFTARFTPSGIDLIVWVFDASGTRARTWRGSATRRSGNVQGRGPT